MRARLLLWWKRRALRGPSGGYRGVLLLFPEANARTWLTRLCGSDHEEWKIYDPDGACWYARSLYGPWPLPDRSEGDLVSLAMPRWYGYQLLQRKGWPQGWESEYEANLRESHEANRKADEDWEEYQRSLVNGEGK